MTIYVYVSWLIDVFICVVIDLCFSFDLTKGLQWVDTLLMVLACSLLPAFSSSLCDDV